MAAKRPCLPVSDWCLQPNVLPPQHPVMAWFLQRHAYFVADVLRIVVFGFAGFFEGRWTPSDNAEPETDHPGDPLFFTTCNVQMNGCLLDSKRWWHSMCIGADVKGLASLDPFARVINTEDKMPLDGPRIATRAGLEAVLTHPIDCYWPRGPIVLTVLCTPFHSIFSFLHSFSLHPEGDEYVEVRHCRVELSLPGATLLLATRGDKEVGLLLRLTNGQLLWASCHLVTGVTVYTNLALVHHDQPLPGFEPEQDRVSPRQYRLLSDLSALAVVNHTIVVVFRHVFHQYDWNGVCLLSLSLPYPRRPFYDIVGSNLSEISVAKWQLGVVDSLGFTGRGPLRVSFDCERVLCCYGPGGSYSTTEVAHHACTVNIE